MLYNILIERNKKRKAYALNYWMVYVYTKFIIIYYMYLNDDFFRYKYLGVNNVINIYSTRICNLERLSLF